MINTKDITGMLKTLRNRDRFCIAFVFISCSICFSFALNFSGFLQVVLVLTGCFAIWVVTIFLFIIPLILSKKKIS
jgi:hypothetical protein